MQLMQLTKDLNQSIHKLEYAVGKAKTLSALKDIRSYAGALVHPLTDEISKTIDMIEKRKGKITSEDLQLIQQLCKKLKEQ